MNEVVRNAIDIPRNAHRVDEAKNEHDPEGNPWEEIEHPEEIETMANCGQYRQRVPAGMRKNLRIRFRRFDDDCA